MTEINYEDDLVANAIAAKEEQDKMLTNKLNLQRLGKLVCEICKKEKAQFVMYNSNLGVCAKCSGNPIANYWNR